MKLRKNLIGIGIILFGLFISIFLIAKKDRLVDQAPPAEGLKEASFYESLGDGRVQCNLCPNRCILEAGQRGLCQVRQNIKGKLYSLVYGKPVSINLDPIEKKPLYHFLPGSKAYSLATAGCNLDCKYCQNWDIAHRLPEDLESKEMTPEEVVAEAKRLGADSIAFTYNEPVVWYEYMLDIAKIAKEKNLRTVMISSGYINQEPLLELLPYLDAVKVDFKSFNSQVYAELIRGRLEPVLDTIKTVKKSGTWLELVHLVVPGYTDDLEETKEMCFWIKENIGVDTPIHFSRFWPKYKLLNLPATPENSLKQARQTCLEAGLKYVYIGNIDDLESNATYCPENQQVLISRQGHIVKENLIGPDGRTADCPSVIPGVWQ